MRVIFVKNFIHYDNELDVFDEFPVTIKAGQEGELLDDTTGRIKIYDGVVQGEFFTEVTGVQPDFYIPKRTDIE